MPARVRRVGLGFGSAPPEFVKPLVVDPEVMGHLVHHGDRDLLQQILPSGTHPFQGALVESDLVWHRTGEPLVPLGQRSALVEPEQLRLLGWGLRLDEDWDASQLDAELPGDEFHGLFNGLIEFRCAETVFALLVSMWVVHSVML